jgi:hypothetical protein
MYTSLHNSRASFQIDNIYTIPDRPAIRAVFVGAVVVVVVVEVVGMVVVVVVVEVVELVAVCLILFASLPGGALLRLGLILFL